MSAVMSSVAKMTAVKMRGDGRNVLIKKPPVREATMAQPIGKVPAKVRPHYAKAHDAKDFENEICQ